MLQDAFFHKQYFGVGARHDDSPRNETGGNNHNGKNNGKTICTKSRTLVTAHGYMTASILANRSQSGGNTITQVLDGIVLHAAVFNMCAFLCNEEAAFTSAPQKPNLATPRMYFRIFLATLARMALTCGQYLPEPFREPLCIRFCSSVYGFRLPSISASDRLASQPNIQQNIVIVFLSCLHFFP